MTPLQAATLRLQTAAAFADERGRCPDVRGSDIRLVLAELARLQEIALDQAPRD